MNGLPDQKTSQDIWRSGVTGTSAGQMLRRINIQLASDTWVNFARELAVRKGGPQNLKVVEVGCGSGTMAMTLGLLGADVTLLDSSAAVLEQTKRLYGALGCEARFVAADCLEEPGPGLAGTFDIVLSGGLAEHFTGVYRERCFKHHHALLKPGGMAMIGVPNRFSPFYRAVRLFRELTGTWELDVEVPFSRGELLSCAAKAGFNNCLVLGTAPLLKDFLVYSRGLISAAADLLPEKFVKRVRGLKAERESRLPSSEQPRDYVARRCREEFERARAQGRGARSARTLDVLSSSLMLLGFK